MQSIKKYTVKCWVMSTREKNKARQRDRESEVLNKVIMEEPAGQETLEQSEPAKPRHASTASAATRQRQLQRKRPGAVRFLRLQSKKPRQMKQNEEEGHARGRNQKTS